MIPLQRISTRAVIPTTIVTSPGCQVSACRRAMIQERMNGAVHAITSSTSSLLNVCQPLASELGPTDPIFTLGLELVENQGSHSDPSSTNEDAQPRNSAGESLETSRKGPSRASASRRQPAPRAPRPEPSTAVTTASTTGGSGRWALA